MIKIRRSTHYFPVRGRIFGCGALSLLLVSCLLIVSGPTDANDWQLEKEVAGITLYTRPHPGSNIPEFRAVATYNSNLEELLDILIQVEAFSTWVYQCQRAAVLHKVSDNEFILYQVNSIPFPFAANRDVIYHGKIFDHRNDDNHTSRITFQLQADAKYCDDPANEGCEKVETEKVVRIEHMLATYELTQIADDQVELVWEQHFDPGGKFPSWIISSMLLKLPANSLIALRTLIEKPDG